MKHTAKLAGQTRHSVTTLGGGIMADAMAGAAVVNDALAELGIELALNTTQELVIGLLVAGAGFVMSWRDRAKKIGKGDPE